ncbi:MAG: gliding motility protein GldN [Bacteroidales bacterium]|jgi:gliding motility associated protien GldN|nr:gliding motility protein GldN [Bacteroidales bacterium]
MRILKRFFPVICLLFVGSAAEAQYNPVLDGAYVREHTAERTPVALQNIREEDAMFSKKILRVVELTEKINHPLYFPITRITSPGGLQPQRSRVNLLYLIYNIGILGERYELLTGEKINDDVPDYSNRYPVFKLNPRDITNWYKEPIAVDDPKRETLLSYQTMGRRYIDPEDPSLGEMEEVFDAPLEGEDTRVMDQLWIWEEWVFDKQRSVMDVRIQAMAIDGWYGDSRIWPFWISYNDYRPLFASYETFNTHNDAEPRTFDDIFLKRRFKSYIVAESNVYDNRLISDYLLGIDALREGERIQAKLFTFEHDLWEF